MISRRNIRIKVLQVLYSIACAEIRPTPADIQKTLRQQFDQTGNLLLYLVYMVTETAQYAEIYARQRANRLLPTAEDLKIDVRLAGNPLILQILNDPHFSEAVKRAKPHHWVDGELVKKLFLELEQTEAYRNYLNADPSDTATAAEIVRILFNEIMLPSEDFETTSTEIFNNYDDDIDMLHLLVNSYLEKPGSLNFNRIISREKEDFARQLAQTTLDKEEVAMEFIRPRLRNWDPERVARIDMLLLRMGVCELLFFETIPPKVTINEYIDLAKAYSTKQSGQFVNGILDNIHKELLEQNRINKVDFRKPK